MKYWLNNTKEKLLLTFWWKVPRSWIYWAVIAAWADVSTNEYKHLTPGEITWDMTCKALEARGNRESKV